MTRLSDLTTPTYPCVGEPYYTGIDWVSVVHISDNEARYIGWFTTPEAALEAAQAEVERMKDERTR